MANKNLPDWATEETPPADPAEALPDWAKDGDGFTPSQETPPQSWGAAAQSWAKQAPLGLARGLGSLLTAGAASGIAESAASNPRFREQLEEKGQKLPTFPSLNKQKDEKLVDMGVNSPDNMPKDVPGKMISGAFESVPWSLGMGPVGAAGNVGIGMAGGAAGPLAEHISNAKTPEEKFKAHLIGSLVGSFGAAGAMGIARSIYNIFSAPVRRLPGEFNLPATRGMLEPEGSPARAGMLAEEQAMERGARGPVARRVMAGPAAQRQQEIEGHRFGTLLDNEAETATPLAAGENVSGTLRQEAAGLEDQGNTIYNSARDRNPTRIIDEQDRPIATIDQSLRYNRGIPDPETLVSYPAAQRARTLIQNMQDAMERLPTDRNPATYTAQFNDMWQTLKDIRRIRPANAADAEILGDVRNTYHGWMRNTLDRVLFTGDNAIVDDLAQADSIWRRLRQITDVDTRNPARDYTRLTSGILHDARTPDQVANYLLNVSSVDGAAKASRMADFVRNTFGADSDVWRSIQQGALHKALLADRPERNGLELANSIRNFTDGKGAALSRTLFDQDAIQRLREFGNSIRRVNPPQSNASGSGHEAGRTAWHMILGAVGLAEMASGLHMAPTKWALAGGVPIVMMLNNGRRALHATRETMEGPGVRAATARAGVGAAHEAADGEWQP